MRVDGREEIPLGHAQNRRRLERDGGRGEALAFEERDGADGLARAEEAEDHVAVRARLDDLHAADCDEAQVRGLVPFAEDLFALLVGDGPAHGAEELSLVRVEAPEERNRVEVGKRGPGHGRSIERPVRPALQIPSAITTTPVAAMRPPATASPQWSSHGNLSREMPARAGRTSAIMAPIVAVS